MAKMQIRDYDSDFFYPNTNLENVGIAARLDMRQALWLYSPFRGLYIASIEQCHSDITLWWLSVNKSCSSPISIEYFNHLAIRTNRIATIFEDVPLPELQKAIGHVFSIHTWD